MLRAPARLLDRSLTATGSSRYGIAVPATHCTPIGAERLIELYGQFMKGYALVPEYTVATLGWLIDDIASQLPAGESLRMMEVRDAGERTMGWFVYVRSQAGAVQVIQMGGRPDKMPVVLDALVYQAHREDALYVAGRMQPEYIAWLGTGPMHLSREGPWVLACSREPAMVNAIHGGNAWLSRLEGEWWMNF
jgi:hypothetical protein